jgi:hypothetical protein
MWFAEDEPMAVPDAQKKRAVNQPSKKAIVRVKRMTVARSNQHRTLLIPSALTTSIKFRMC